MSALVYVVAAGVLLLCTVALVLHYTSKGPTGPAGDKGPTGKDGAATGKGAPGDAGAKGATGPKGRTGPVGEAGSNGTYTAASGVYQPSATLRFTPGLNDTDITAFLSTQDPKVSYNLILDPGSASERTFSLSRADFYTEGYMFTICNASSAKDFYIVPPTASAASPAVPGAWDNPADCSLLKYAAIPPRVTVPKGRCVMVLVTKGTTCPSNSVCSGSGTPVSCTPRTFWYLNFVTSQNTIERKCNSYMGADSKPIPCPS